MAAGTLPDYRDDLGRFSDLPRNLDQTYTGVTTQVFPLRASLSRLQNFCDTYLNFTDVDPCPLQFKAAFPWVLLEISDYGSVALQSQNVGWFAQHETVFAIPLEMYRLNPKGESKFDDFVLMYPFIFVDSPVSMSHGREVYGWPKVRVKFKKVSSLFQPDQPRLLFDISLPIETAYNSIGEGTAVVDFLKVYQAVGPSLSNWNGVERWFSAVPKAVSSYFSAISDIWGLGSSSNIGVDPDYVSLQKMLARRFGDGSSMFAGLYGGGRRPSSRSMSGAMNIATLKEFRDAEQPQFACYQGIVLSQLKVSGWRDGGWLFDPLSGDTSGGFSINIYDQQTEQVVEMLGIEAEQSSVGTQTIYTIEPSFPFWSQTDFQYGLAHEVCWRSIYHLWSFNNDPYDDPKHKGSPSPYRITGGGAQQEVPAPYTFPDLTLRMLTLPVADNGVALQKLCDHYLQNDLYDFKVVDHPAVVLIAGSYDNAQSSSSPGTFLSDSELIFTMAVYWRPKKDTRAEWKVACVPLYSFVGTEWDAMTDYEVYGRFAFPSYFRRPSIEWLKETSVLQGVYPPNLLTVESFLCPQLKKPQRVERIPIFSITRIPPDLEVPPPPGWWELPPTASTPPPSSKGSEKRPPPLDPVMAPYIQRCLHKLSLDVFRQTDPNSELFYSIALKQIRDAKEGANACYQALVGVPRTFSANWRAPAFSFERLVIRINSYETLPLVQTLGLEAYDDPTDPRVKKVYSLDGLVFSGTMQVQAGQNLSWRAGSEPWQPQSPIPWPPGQPAPTARRGG